MRNRRPAVSHRRFRRNHSTKPTPRALIIGSIAPILQNRRSATPHRRFSRTHSTKPTLNNPRKRNWQLYFANFLQTCKVKLPVSHKLRSLHRFGSIPSPNQPTPSTPPCPQSHATHHQRRCMLLQPFAQVWNRKLHIPVSRRINHTCINQPLTITPGILRIPPNPLRHVART